MAKNRVAKLTYRLRGPYVVVEILEHGAYSLRKFNKPKGAVLKYHAEDISMLPPAIRPVEPLDGPDLRYLNNAHAPIPHPLKQAFNIKLYNEMWFSQPIDATPPKLLRDITPVSFPSDSAGHPSRSVPCTPELAMSPTVTSDVDFEVVHQQPGKLFQAVQQSRDKLFFVSFRPKGTFRARWYLVGIDTNQTESIAAEHGDLQHSGIYYVHFFARHPADNDETDPSARWWPEWREYSTGNDGIIDYGVCILFPPTRVPDASQFIAWADVMNLSNPAIRLLGPFDFMEPCTNPGGRSPSYRQYVPTQIWAQLAELCISNGILPPRLTVMTPSLNKQRKRKGVVF